MDGNEITNLVHAITAFAVYLFIMVSLYFLISSPVDIMLGSFDDVPLGDATDEMAYHLPNIQWAVKVVFAIGGAIPMTWFIFWVFSHDPFMGMVKRRI